MADGKRYAAAGKAALAARNAFHKGDPVSWHYRSAVGHGYVQSVARQGATPAETLYNVRQVDNHVSASGSHEKTIVQHTGAALTRSTKEAVEAAAKAAKAAGR